MCSFSLRFVLTWHHSVSPAHASPLNEDEDDIDHVAASRMHQLLALCRTVHDHTKGVPHMSSLSTICRVCEHVQLSDVQQLPFSDEDTATWVCMQSLSGVMQSHSVLLRRTLYCTTALHTSMASASVYFCCSVAPPSRCTITPACLWSGLSCSMACVTVSSRNVIQQGALWNGPRRVLRLV